MGIVELFKLLLSEDGEIVIPINDEEKDEYVCEVEAEFGCILPNGESENIVRLKKLVGKLPSMPNGPAPKFELEKNEI